MIYKIENIFIDNKVKDDSLTVRIAGKFDASSVVFGVEEDLKVIIRGLTPSRGKQSILLTEQKGKALKDCPGMTESYLCCRLQVLSPIANCPMFCSYCFLQFYLNSNIITIYTNLEKQKKEVTDLLDSQPKRLFRITTGELSDSLAFDKETDFSAELMAHVLNKPNVILELKTKTDHIDHLLSLDHGGRIVLSWSLNPQQIVQKEEYLSASLEKRIDAARKVSKAGFLLGFHFDPLICYPTWEQDYHDLIKYLFERVEKTRIAWVSIGALRFSPGMEDEMKKCFPKSKIPYGEFVKAADGKMRYIRPIRFELYKKVISWLREYGGSELFVYLCMEMANAWEAAMGFRPDSQSHLDYLFAQNLHHRFPESFSQRPCLDDYV